MHKANYEQGEAMTAPPPPDEKPWESEKRYAREHSGGTGEAVTPPEGKPTPENFWGMKRGDWFNDDATPPAPAADVQPDFCCDLCDHECGCHTKGRRAAKPAAAGERVTRGEWKLRPPTRTTAYIDTPKGGISISCDGLPDLEEWKEICALIAAAPTTARLLDEANAGWDKAVKDAAAIYEKGYAQAVAQERERCAKIAEGISVCCNDYCESLHGELAARIREGGLDKG